MGLLKTVILGRENGIRSRLRRMVFGGPVDTSPGSAYSAPREEPPPPAEAALGLQPEAPKDVTPPDGYEVVLHKDALVSGRITEIIIAGTAIAVANAEGTFRACANTCRHADKVFVMGEGQLDGTRLTDPYHGWVFDLADGSCETNPEVTLQLFDVQVVGDAVCVRV